jgi:hypothetical protein
MVFFALFYGMMKKEIRIKYRGVELQITNAKGKE